MNTQWLRAGAMGSFIAAGLLVVQFIIGSVIGTNLGILDMSFNLAHISAFLQMQEIPMTLLMVTDNLFVVAYTVAFVGLAFYLLPRNRLLALVALGFALLTSATDFTENSLTIVMTRAAANGATLESGWLLVLQILAQLKYLWIYVAVTLFAIGIWDKPRMHRIVAVLFWLFPILGIGAAFSVAATMTRVLWMFVLLIAGGIFLWRSHEA